MAGLYHLGKCIGVASDFEQTQTKLPLEHSENIDLFSWRDIGRGDGIEVLSPYFYRANK